MKRICCSKCGTPTAVFSSDNPTVYCALCVFDTHQVLRFLGRRATPLPETADELEVIDNAIEIRKQKSNILSDRLRKHALVLADNSYYFVYSE